MGIPKFNASEYPSFTYEIPYSNTSSLNTYDLILPRPLSESSPDKTVVLVYIHGGAWIDPHQLSSEILPSLSWLFPSEPVPAHPHPSVPGSPTEVLKPDGSLDLSRLINVAGIISLNYRLSPHPSKDPSSSSLSHDRASYSARHPDHINDILTALSHLSSTYSIGITYRCIGVGHSAGATLWSQIISLPPSSLPSLPSTPSPPLPSALGLIAGISSLPLLVQTQSNPFYRLFVTAAFSSDEAVWRAASPAEVGDFSEARWKEGKFVVDAVSREDELVDAPQSEALKGRLGWQGWRVGEFDEEGVDWRNGRPLLEYEMFGAHDNLWADGKQLAKYFIDLVGLAVDAGIITKS